MGKQGKGILGGFSGKVGLIQGYRRLGKDIIQTCPTFKTRVLGWLWDFEFTEYIEVLNVIIGQYFIRKQSSGGNYTRGAVSPMSHNKFIGGIEFQQTIGASNYHIAAGIFDGTILFSGYPQSIRVRFTKVRVYNFALVVVPDILIVIGTKFRMVLNDGNLEYWMDTTTGLWVKFYEQEYLGGFPVSFMAGLSGSNTTVDNTKQGGTSLTPTIIP